MNRKRSTAFKLTLVFMITVAAGLSVWGRDRGQNDSNRKTAAPSAGIVLSHNLERTFLRVPSKFPVVSKAVSSSVALVIGRFDTSQEQVTLVLQGCVFLLCGHFWMKKSRRAAAIISRS
jgi:hypothetical protein